MKHSKQRPEPKKKLIAPTLFKAPKLTLLTAIVSTVLFALCLITAIAAVEFNIKFLNIDFEYSMALFGGGAILSAIIGWHIKEVAAKLNDTKIRALIAPNYLRSAREVIPRLTELFNTAYFTPYSYKLYVLDDGARLQFDFEHASLPWLRRMSFSMSMLNTISEAHLKHATVHILQQIDGLKLSTKKAYVLEVELTNNNLGKSIDKLQLLKYFQNAQALLAQLANTQHAAFDATVVTNLTTDLQTLLITLDYVRTHKLSTLETPEIAALTTLLSNTLVDQGLQNTSQTAVDLKQLINTALQFLSRLSKNYNKHCQFEKEVDFAVLVDHATQTATSSQALSEACDAWMTTVQAAKKALDTLQTNHKEQLGQAQRKLEAEAAEARRKLEAEAAETKRKAAAAQAAEAKRLAELELKQKAAADKNNLIAAITTHIQTLKRLQTAEPAYDIDHIQQSIRRAASIVAHHGQHNSLVQIQHDLTAANEALQRASKTAVQFSQGLAQYLPNRPLMDSTMEDLKKIEATVLSAIAEHKNLNNIILEAVIVFNENFDLLVAKGNALTEKDDALFAEQQKHAEKAARKAARKAAKKKATAAQATKSQSDPVPPTNNKIDYENIRKEVYFTSQLRDDVRFKLALHCLDLYHTLRTQLKEHTLDPHTVYGAHQYIALKLAYTVYQLSALSNPYTPLHDWIDNRDLLYHMRNVLVHLPSQAFMFKLFQDQSHTAQAMCDALMCFEVPLRQFNRGTGITTRTQIDLLSQPVFTQLPEIPKNLQARIPCLLDNLKFYAQGLQSMQRDALKLGFEKFNLNGPLQCGMQYYVAMIGECLTTLRKQFPAVYQALNMKVNTNIEAVAPVDRPARDYMSGTATLFENKRHIVAHAFSEEDAGKKFGEMPHINDTTMGRAIYQDILPDELLKIAQLAPFVETAVDAQLKAGKSARNPARLLPTPKVPATSYAPDAPNASVMHANLG